MNVSQSDTHETHPPRSRWCWLPYALTLMLSVAAFADQEPPSAPEPELLPELQQQVEHAPVVLRLIDDPITSDNERQQLRVFHGLWDDMTDLSVQNQAQLALLRYELNAPALQDKQVPVLVRATAALLRDEPDTTIELLREADTIEAAVVQAQAMEMVGRVAEAAALLEPWREVALHRQRQLTSAPQLTAAARVLVTLARLQGRPAQDYQLAMNLLAQARTIDPLYWPALIAEGRILIEKDNVPDAVEALAEALTLNPHSSDAWYELGWLSARGFDFQRAADAVAQLRQINIDHPLATELDIHSRLVQRDVSGARSLLQEALERRPNRRQLVALQAAMEALSYDDQAMRQVLDRYDQRSPDSPRAWYLVGTHLSLARQYDEAETALREAIARQPNWPAPHVELGLLLMQAGRDEAARDALSHAVRLDPFNRRAANQLKLVEQLLGYDRIETDHFIIRYRAGIDAVLARDMPPVLEGIYRDITSAFSHEPAVKTHIDIMPNDQWFGVRITGMPEIWTIGASTGDVISITPPREGPRQRGTYDWANVIRHEYVHTVTLSQTNNRLPHWFTEACAVSQELTDRDYNTCQLLAWALHNDKLFTLDTINWGFIRPQTPRDRPLAYAQSHWMVQYLTQTYGHAAILDLLTRFSRGQENAPAIEAVTGEPADVFLTHFKAWAADQVRAWGLEPAPDDPALETLLAAQQHADPAAVQTLLQKYPQQPDLLRLAAEQALASDDLQAARKMVLQYAAARPVDPWPHRQMATIALKLGRTEEAVASMSELDRLEAQHGRWAYQLAKLHRTAGRLDAAREAIARALRREPYNGTYRELAATLALQQQDFPAAQYQLLSMTYLEPSRAIHQVRLAAIYHRMGETVKAGEAAKRARELDPNAPVDRFLNDQTTNE